MRFLCFVYIIALMLSASSRVTALSEIETTFIYSHPVHSYYPKSVPFGSLPSGQSADNDGTKKLTSQMRLTADSLEAVAAYYRSLMGPYDEYEEFQPNPANHWQGGFRILFYNCFSNTYGADIVNVAGVTVLSKDYSSWLKAHTGGSSDFSKFTGDISLPFPLLMMKKMIGQNGHTMEEFQKYAEKFARLALWYYPVKLDASFVSLPADMEICLKYSVKAIPEWAGKTPDETQKLYFSAYGTNKIVQPGTAWGVWIECLAKMEKAGYPLYLVHEGVWK
ncbi:MAG: hypothetical protein A2Y33_05685 [Spirochaetes bacterium GWF1_51_8]|nr:MAG: hypothetical protein A2Y33_05685 [Spirochaetes bacterium GWF1_51_8]